MMNAIYPERPGMLDALSGLLGGPALTSAALLAALAVVLGFLGSAGASRPEAARASEVAALRGAVDSMAGRLTILTDSLRRSLATTASSGEVAERPAPPSHSGAPWPAAATPASGPARRTSAVKAAPAIAPSLPPAPALPTTTP